MVGETRRGLSTPEYHHCVVVDVYGDAAVVQWYRDDGPAADDGNRDQVYDALAALGCEELFLKIRPVQANLLLNTWTASTGKCRLVGGPPAAAARPVLKSRVGNPG
jgi:hypothetical protein